MTATVTYATVNGRLMMENRGGVKTAYVSDTLGNLIQCRDASGNKTYEAFYWSYGEIRASSGTNPSPWGFVGLLGYYTDALNYLYVRARYYRPNLTRWQTVDPHWAQESPYLYCHDSPVSRSDEFGFQVEIVLGGAAAGGCVAGPPGAIVGGVVAGIAVLGLGVWCWIRHCEASRETESGTCPPPPPPKTVWDPPQKRGHYYKALGCCCYGPHTHIITYFVGPFPDCRIDGRKSDGECFGICIPGGCL